MQSDNQILKEIGRVKLLYKYKLSERGSLPPVKYPKRDIKEIMASEAIEWFRLLPKEKQLATLSPEYVLADAKRDDAVSPCFLLYTEKDNFCLSSMLKGIVPNTDFIDFQSPYGYGGPVSNSDDPDFLNIAWIYYTGWCHTNKVLAEFIRLHPLGNQPYYGDNVENRQTVTIPVDTEYTPACRNKVRRAEREGLEVIEVPKEEIATSFSAFYRTGMDKLNADGFYYFNDAYFDAFSKFAHLLVCHLDGEWLSAGIFLEGGDTLEYHLACTTDRGRELAATNLLIDRALVFTKARGLKQLYLGGGKTAAPNDPLLQFKTSFNGQLKPFSVGSCIHHPTVYYAMEKEHNEVSPVNTRTLFWR